MGKSHLGEQDQCHPLARGSDELFGFLGGARTYWPAQPGTAPSRREHASRLLRGRELVVETEYMTFAFGGEAVNFISLQRGKDQPFFLYLAFNAAQNPMEAPDDYLQGVVSFANKRRQAYAGMLSAIDDVIGRVLKALRDGALEEKTLPVIQMDLTATALPLAVALPSKDYNISVLGLYDLNQDLGESHDLSSAQPERVNQLQAAWARWRKGVEGDKPISKHNLKNVNNAP